MSAELYAELEEATRERALVVADYNKLQGEAAALRATNQRLTEQVERMKAEMRNYSVTISTICDKTGSYSEESAVLAAITSVCDAMTDFANSQPKP